MNIESTTSFLKFSSNGQTYQLMFTVDTNIGDNQIDIQQLNNTNVKQFQYSNALNSLYLTGKFVYRDNEGKLDKFIDKQTCYLNVVFNRIFTQQEGSTQITKIDKEQTFSHSFFIKSIKILSRNKTDIVYELDLVGDTWVNLMQSAVYTNYGNEKEDIMKIVQILLKDYAKLKVSDKFMDILSKVKIDYITTGCQSIADCIYYLMSKLYYYSNKDSELKFLLYDCMLHEYVSKSMSNFIDEDGPIWTDIIALTNNGTVENMTSNIQPTNIGTVTSFPRTSEFIMKFTQHMNYYSYDENKFSDNVITNKAIVSYINSGNNDSKLKPNVDFGNTEYKLDRTCSYWNNNLDIYHDAVSRYLNDNALVINVAGEICRMPGQLQCISIEKKVYYEESDSEEYKELNKKFDSLQGKWYIGKVVNILDVENSMYRQNLVLFRNIKMF